MSIYKKSSNEGEISQAVGASLRDIYCGRVAIASGSHTDAEETTNGKERGWNVIRSP